MRSSGLLAWWRSSSLWPAPVAERGARPAVGAYIGAAYWFTSSTSFANRSVSVGRMFSDTFAGIAPASVPGFVAAQLVGGLPGVGLVRVLYPDVAAALTDTDPATQETVR